MNKLKDLPVGKQVLFMFGTLCAILVLIGALLFFSLRSIERSSQEKLSYVVNESELVSAAAQNVGLTQAVIFRHILATDPAEIKGHDQTIYDIDKASADKFDAYQRFVDTEEEGRLYARVLQARKEYMKLTDQVLALSRVNQNPEAAEFAVSKQVPAYEKYQKTIKDMTSYVETEVRDIAATMEYRIARIRLIGDIFVLIAILIALGTGFAVTGVARRLKEDNRTLQIEVTERKRAEETLGSLRREYELILQSVGEGIHGISLDGKIIFENAAAARLLGEEVEDLIGKPAHETIHHSREDGSAYPKEECPIYQTLRDGVVRRSSKEVFWRSDGSSFPVDYVSAPLRDERGDIAGGVVAFRDITERKEAEGLTRASEERYRSLFESNPSPMWVFDVETLSFLAVNAAALRHYGYSKDEFLAMTLKDIRPSEDIPALMHDLAQKKDDVTHLNQSRHCTKDRTLIDVEITWHELTWLGRRAKVTLINDVTKRKRAEQKLLEQANLLNLAQDAIMVRDMDDRIQFWSHGAELLYGWSAEEVCGGLTSDFLDYEVPKKILAERILLETGVWSGECHHLTKQGDTIIVRSRWTLVRDELGQPKSKLIITTDITGQKEIEEQFLRAQRLESIGTLASGVAHDLNNILVPILMAAPLLREEMPAEDREKLLALVQSSAERGASIIKQVLTFARGADGDHVLLQPIYLVQEIAKIAEKTFPKSVVIRTKYPEDLWTIEANPTQLHQILLNLCINARDAMPTGGTLTLALDNFEVDDHYAGMTPGAKAGPHVFLEVSDTGTGIPRQIIDRIFDPFFTTKELGQGTGLGLSTVIGIVKSHGGFMEVESKVGRGTSFKVFLPANTSEVAAGQIAEAAPLPPANGELLLIVDDEKAILQVAKAVLEDHGYRVVSAADATEALAIFALRMNEIRLVLTDLELPVIDGVALIRTLQKMKPDVRVIASTGRGSQNGRADQIAQLNVPSLTKPYNKNKLLAILHDVLAHAPDNPMCESSLAKAGMARKVADELTSLNVPACLTQPYPHEQPLITLH